MITMQSWRTFLKEIKNSKNIIIPAQPCPNLHTKCPDGVHITRRSIKCDMVWLLNRKLHQYVCNSSNFFFKNVTIHKRSQCCLLHYYYLWWKEWHGSLTNTKKYRKLFSAEIHSNDSVIDINFSILKEDFSNLTPSRCLSRIPRRSSEHSENPKNCI